VRLGKLSFGSKIKSKLHFEFSRESLTSYAGLEVIREYLLETGFVRRLKNSDAEQRWKGDFRFSSAVLLLLSAILVGARRLRHLEYLQHDPMILRAANISQMPTTRTVARSLAKVRMLELVDLAELSRSVVVEGLSHHNLPRITLDIDGSVITTGQKVEGAARGYNPHNRKNPSYYPIGIMIAQTGHVWSQENRPGNIHDANDADATIRKAVAQLNDEMNFKGVVELRADSAFFSEGFLEACDSTDVEYAIKVPMWPWLNIKSLVKKCTKWTSIDSKGNVQGTFTSLLVNQWGRTEAIAIYRTKRSNRPTKGVQLDLFNPDDGFWEYSVVATNKTLGLKALHAFSNGRGAQEKTIGELKTGFAYDSVVSKKEGANAAWQKLAILAHNISVSLQLRHGAQRKARSAKRTTAFFIQRIATLRFEWLNRAGRILRPQGKLTIRLADNDNVREHYEKFGLAEERAA